MAIRVDYNKRMGYYLATACNGKKAKVWLCGANCLWAEINFYREEKDGKRHDMAQLCGFFCDHGHLKRYLADVKDAHFKGMTFFAKEMDADLWKAVKILTENGIKITIK